MSKLEDLNKLNKLIKNIRIKNIASRVDVKELTSFFNSYLKTIVDEKREIINKIVKETETNSGFYQVDVKVPWSILLHRFDGALIKYEKASLQYNVYNILVSELIDLKPYVKQILAIKDNKMDSLHEEFPLTEKLNEHVVKMADMLEESVLPTLKQMCLECSLKLRWVKYDELLSQELARIRSAAYSKLFELNPIKVENYKLKSGRDGIEGKWYITEENDSCWKFEFTAILAGGFNIQCLHTRTISNLTQLR